MQLASEAYKIVNKLPGNETYTFRDQIIRSSISIPSNIAEGCSRVSRNDFKRFLRISLGSSFELETHFLLLEQNGIVDPKLLERGFRLLTEVEKILHTLLKKP